MYMLQIALIIDRCNSVSQLHLPVESRNAFLENFLSTSELDRSRAWIDALFTYPFGAIFHAIIRRPIVINNNRYLMGASGLQL